MILCSGTSRRCANIGGARLGTGPFLTGIRRPVVTNYYTDLFTPETWAAFRSRGGTICGFPKRQRKAVEALEEGDILCCYMTKLSRWCGVVEVASGAYEDETPYFTDPDPFVIRIKVKPHVVLDPELSIPISELWPRL